MLLAKCFHRQSNSHKNLIKWEPFSLLFVDGKTEALFIHEELAFAFWDFRVELMSSVECLVPSRL